MQSAKEEARVRKEKLAQSYQQLLNDFSTGGDLKNVGNYALGQLIGKGSFGRVYLATHKLTNGAKVVLKSADKNDANLAREIHHHRQFIHPHIAQLYEVIITERHVWMVLEYCPGDELYNYLLRHGPLPVDKTQRIFAQLVGAVSYVHQKSCVHRDLKLENILLDKQENVKLVDFGFTREYEGRANYLQTFCGTICYAAPEMLKGEKYAGEKVDVWSLGVILYALLCGELPFDDDDDNVTRTRILTDEPKFPGHLTPDALSLLQSLLAKRPLHRPTLPTILAHPFLAAHAPAQQAILERPQPPLFSTPVERECLHRMHSAGVNMEALVDSVTGQKCDTLAGWWSLLRLKEERKAKRREQRRKERDREPREPFDNRSLRRLSAASSRLLPRFDEDAAAAGSYFVPGSTGASDPPTPRTTTRGRSERRSFHYHHDLPLHHNNLPNVLETTPTGHASPSHLSPHDAPPTPIEKDSLSSVAGTCKPIPPPKEGVLRSAQSRGSTLHLVTTQDLAAAGVYPSPGYGSSQHGRRSASRIRMSNASLLNLARQNSATTYQYADPSHHPNQPPNTNNNTLHITMDEGPQQPPQNRRGGDWKRRMRKKPSQAILAHWRHWTNWILENTRRPKPHRRTSLSTPDLHHHHDQQKASSSSSSRSGGGGGGNGGGGGSSGGDSQHTTTPRPQTSKFLGVVMGASVGSGSGGGGDGRSVSSPSPAPRPSPKRRDQTGRRPDGEGKSHGDHHPSSSPSTTAAATVHHRTNTTEGHHHHHQHHHVEKQTSALPPGMMATGYAPAHHTHTSSSSSAHAGGRKEAKNEAGTASLVYPTPGLPPLATSTIMESPHSPGLGGTSRRYTHYKRQSLSPSPVTPHSGLRRPSGLRGRKSTSSSVSSVRSIHHHHYSHSKASSTSSNGSISAVLAKTTPAPSGGTGGATNRGTSPSHRSIGSASGSGSILGGGGGGGGGSTTSSGGGGSCGIKVLPATPTTLPSNIRLVRNGSGHHYFSEGAGGSYGHPEAFAGSSMMSEGGGTGRRRTPAPLTLYAEEDPGRLGRHEAPPPLGSPNPFAAGGIVFAKRRRNVFKGPNFHRGGGGGVGLSNNSVFHHHPSKDKEAALGGIAGEGGQSLSRSRSGSFTTSLGGGRRSSEIAIQEEDEDDYESVHGDDDIEEEDERDMDPVESLAESVEESELAGNRQKGGDYDDDDDERDPRDARDCARDPRGGPYHDEGDMKRPPCTADDQPGLGGPSEAEDDDKPGGEPAVVALAKTQATTTTKALSPVLAAMGP